MRQIHDTEMLPNSVEATEQLLIKQGTEYTKLKVNSIWAKSSENVGEAFTEHGFYFILGWNSFGGAAGRGIVGGDTQKDGNVCGQNRQYKFNWTVSWEHI